MCGRVMHAGETATEAGDTHPTGMRVPTDQGKWGKF